METIRINAWSSPRNISTALMYSFAQRPDTFVVDEPLYAHYLSCQPTEVEHPGKAEILDTMEQDGERVIQEQILGSFEKPVVFFKQMTHHLIGLDRGFLDQTENMLLIRDPRRILHSYAKVIPNPSLRDVGIEDQYILFRELQARGKEPVVVDTERLLMHPAGVLEEVCHRLLIPWFPEMLQWEAGARPEDGIWAKYWYSNVHRSTGFLPYQERQIQLPEPLEVIAREAEKFYTFLLDWAI